MTDHSKLQDMRNMQVEVANLAETLVVSAAGSVGEDMALDNQGLSEEELMTQVEDELLARLQDGVAPQAGPVEDTSVLAESGPRYNQYHFETLVSDVLVNRMQSSDLNEHLDDFGTAFQRDDHGDGLRSAYYTSAASAVGTGDSNDVAADMLDFIQTIAATTVDSTDTTAPSLAADEPVGASGVFDNVFVGTQADDVLVGGSLNDFVYGENGDDILVGGRGADEIYGGSGDDIFAFMNMNDLMDTDGDDFAADLIHDFVQGQDLVNIANLLADIGTSDYQLNYVGNDTFLSVQINDSSVDVAQIMNTHLIEDDVVSSQIIVI